ncbi:hypothetical protein Hdeb2414_s0001g00034441 [Helianthus debilis subsp. tardiflorus]
MPEPLSFKKTEPSPSGKLTTGVASNVSRPSPQPIDGGDSASSSPLRYKTEVVFLSRELGSGNIGDMDLAQASEKYIPEWSLMNKDRIVDALSAKMALFHLGTPAEHAHYRKNERPGAWECFDVKSGSVKFLGGGNLKTLGRGGVELP